MPSAHRPIGPSPYERRRTPEPKTDCRAGKRDTVTKRHFQSNLSSQVGWYVIAVLCYTVSHNINTVLLQHAPNLFNLLLIHTTNANATVDLAVSVLNNFELE